jgi:hypothetical protein
VKSTGKSSNEQRIASYLAVATRINNSSQITREIVIPFYFDQKITDYVCFLCQHILQPHFVQCSECQVFNCQKCIADWIKESNTCPGCCSKFNPQKKPNLEMIKKLQALDVKCQRCEEQVKFGMFP